MEYILQHHGVKGQKWGVRKAKRAIRKYNRYSRKYAIANILRREGQDMQDNPGKYTADRSQNKKFLKLGKRSEKKYSKKADKYQQAMRDALNEIGDMKVSTITKTKTTSQKGRDIIANMGTNVLSKNIYDVPYIKLKLDKRSIQ
jgi:hypothetical protein